MDISKIELGPRMSACSEMERRFVIAYVTNNDGNATQAARDAGYSDLGPESAAIRVRAFEVIHRERVILALEEVGKKVFRSLLVPAIRATKLLIENEKHPDHAKVVSSTLARLGLTERTGLDVNVSGELTINHTDSALADLRALLELQVPEAKLVEIFGFSGLSRYRKMLAETDARAPKMIEGTSERISNGN
jgi:hypothetical protein